MTGWQRDPANPTGRYVLGGPDGHTPIAEPDLMVWGSLMESSNRHVALTGNDDVRVSTVFLALDHNFSGDGPPILFETMVFRHSDGDECERYSTWEEAEAGHKRYVEMVFGKALA